MRTSVCWVVLWTQSAWFLASQPLETPTSLHAHCEALLPILDSLGGYYKGTSPFFYRHRRVCQPLQLIKLVHPPRKHSSCPPHPRFLAETQAERMTTNPFTVSENQILQFSPPPQRLALPTDSSLARAGAIHGFVLPLQTMHASTASSTANLIPSCTSLHCTLSCRLRSRCEHRASRRSSHSAAEYLMSKSEPNLPPIDSAAEGLAHSLRPTRRTADIHGPFLHRAHGRRLPYYCSRSEWGKGTRAA
ncbi:hypothetical protein FB451DRAFT_1397412 [Mycena latifolia]|nr:hypothetical protein FB451DRAFT_1397412 [Mycena latifolia]